MIDESRAKEVASKMVDSVKDDESVEGVIVVAYMADGDCIVGFSGFANLRASGALPAFTSRIAQEIKAMAHDEDGWSDAVLPTAQ